MTRRWLQSADVEIDDSTGALSVQGDVASTVKRPSSLTGGTKTTSTSNIAEPLVDAVTLCQFVWIGARVADDGTPQNTGACFIGDSNEQHIPIMMANYEGFVIRIDDAAKLYVRAVNAGDGVVYHVFA